MESKNGFVIVFAYAAIVPPSYGVEKPAEKIESKILEETEPGIEYLIKIFDTAHQACKIGINFISDDHQKNEVRTDILDILNSTNSNHKLKIADKLSESLSKITDDRNKTGLFVILVGKKLETNRIVLIRLRAEEVVYKKSVSKGFKIDKLEQAFSKKSNYYKVAYYEGHLAQRSTFWNGYILDRQKKSETVVSNYWLKEFLKSDYAMSPVQGTRRLADYIKSFVRTLENVQEQRIVYESVRTLRTNDTNDALSVIQYSEDYLPVILRERFRVFVGDDELNNTHFNVDFDTYDAELPYQVFEMQNGISLTIPTFMGENYLEITALNNGNSKYSFEGVLVNQKFTKKPN